MEMLGQLLMDNLQTKKNVIQDLVKQVVLVASNANILESLSQVLYFVLCD